jgi:hypothetical protein
MQEDSQFYLNLIQVAHSLAYFFWKQRFDTLPPTAAVALSVRNVPDWV